MELIREVQPLEGARKLIEDLKGNGHTVVLASSAKRDELEHYLTLLDARTLADDWTDSSDVEQTKPEPDLLLAALEKVGGAAEGRRDDRRLRVGLPGGQARRRALRRRADRRLQRAGARDAGAADVYPAVDELRQDLDETPLRV